MADTRVSVVIITHNRRRELLRTLATLSDLPERPPILVVDNASSDGTPAAVARRHPDVELIQAGGNLGAAGRTLGVERARTAYVAFCDDDTWWAPGSLGRAADLLDAHPRLALVNGRVLIGEAEVEDAMCSELAASPLTRDPELPGKPLLGFVAGASVVRRTAFLEAGGFDPHLFVGGEEGLLALDLAARGWALRYVPELVIHHHPSRHRDRRDRRRIVLRNELWCAWLRRPLPAAVRRTCRLLAGAPHDRVSGRAVLDALRGLPWVLSERRVVPDHVERGLQLLER